MVKKRIPEKIKKHIKEYIKLLKTDNLPIQHIFLFGSYAKGKQHKWSDIDLCIISSKFNDPWEAMQYLWRKRIFDKNITIEPIGFNPKDFKEETSLTHEIKQTGIEIKI
ncbi:MAG: nucleotidyltransferase domain-containing protein [bacterium]